MPSIVKSTKWFVRCDGPHEFLTEKTNIVKGWIDCKRILCFLHNGEKGDNPHCHFVIELSSELQKQSFDVRLKKLYGVSGSGFSSKPWDGEDGACGYMFHEPDGKLCVCKGFSIEDISRFEDLNKATQKVIAINKEKASVKLVDKAYEYMMSIGEFDKVKCLLYMLREIKQGNNYHPGEFMLKRYVEEIEVKMCNDLETLAQSLVFRMWK